MAELAASGSAWRWLIAGEWRAFPLRFLVAGLAIAIGVALAFAVHVVNRSAADAFGEAVRSVSGESDLQVRATTGLGLDERMYPRLIALPEVADASPVVQLRVVIGEAETPVTLLGLDMLRAVNVSPSLAGRPRTGATARASGRAAEMDVAFDTSAIFLSEGARSRAGLDFGDRLLVRAGGEAHPFILAGDLPGVAADQALAVIDISAAQWRFARLGKLDRIDLRLAEGVSLSAGRRAVEAALPPAARIADAEREELRGESLSRAYRVNLDMLALVALVTGGFLVFSAQSLSVTRRLGQFALVRTLGLQRRDLAVQLLGEGALLGTAGSMLGLVFGYALAGAALRFVGGDLGAGYFSAAPAELSFAPGAALLFFAFGIGTAIAGSWLPARQAARMAPAEALKSGSDPVDPRAAPRWWPALAMIVLGAGLAALPPVSRLPLFGYLAVALVLAGGIAGMPWLARTLLRPLDRLDLRSPPLVMALGRLLGAPSQAATALGGIVASTGLMIAMAVMVTSFRGSVDEWLESFLSADLYLGAASTGGLFDAPTQARLADVPGVSSIAFSQSIPVTLDPALPPVHLIIRPVGGPGYSLPLIERAGARPGALQLWLSEPASRLYGIEAGETLGLPLAPGGRPVSGYVAGIWRDYARQQGAIVIESEDYVALTGDRVRSEAAIRLEPGASPAAVKAAIAARLPPEVAGRLDFADPASLRTEALRLFDRSFAITYVLEVIAVLIGLAGVAATVSAQTIARIREFGMLRHVGMTPRQVLAMLAWEGALLGAIGVAAGAATGLALSQILIHVINPQSFNWTMETRIPWALIAGIAALLVITAALTAVAAGRRAVSREAVRAVSEDW